MSDCGECARESERHERIREALRSLPRRSPPADLTVRLRVIASQARSQSGGASPWRRWRNRFQLNLSNLMRPLALPLVGGLCSAVVLFSALVPTFTPLIDINKARSPEDFPTALITEPTVKYMAPVAFDADGVVDLDLSIDDHGRVVGYTIVSVAGPASDQLRRSIQNNLLFTEFWPATAFGQPVAGTVRVSFRSNHVEVRG